jgi:hypothetical protein
MAKNYSGNKEKAFGPIVFGPFEYSAQRSTTPISAIFRTFEFRSFVIRPYELSAFSSESTTFGRFYKIQLNLG